MLFFGGFVNSNDLALLLAWEWGARSLGPLFFAPPLATAHP